MAAKPYPNVLYILILNIAGGPKGHQALQTSVIVNGNARVEVGRRGRKS